MTVENPASVLVETLPTGSGLKIGLATLNAPGSLNSLTREMVDLLHSRLLGWQQDAEIACVLLRGAADRAFCAGGDVVKLRDSALSGDGRAAEFFAREYRLDYLIHVYHKPILVWGHGVVMGGGLGLLAGASHRIVTPKTRLAMPEVSIGLYPDVGASWFLNKMPGRAGLFMALTGVPVNAGDAQYLGLADHFLRHDQWQPLLVQLCGIEWGPEGDRRAQLSRLLKSFAVHAGDPPVSAIRAHYDVIQAMTDAATVDEIVANITAYDGDDPWLKGAAQTLAAGCPTTVRLVYEQLRRSLHMSLKEVFQMEVVISANCMKFPNFAEGVRALLVDKDRLPRFEPATLGAVSGELVAKYFEPPWSGKNPLYDL